VACCGGGCHSAHASASDTLPYPVFLGQQAAGDLRAALPAAPEASNDAPGHLSNKALPATAGGSGSRIAVRDVAGQRGGPGAGLPGRASQGGGAGQGGAGRYGTGRGGTGRGGAGPPGRGGAEQGMAGQGGAGQGGAGRGGAGRKGAGRAASA
jgi:hypothetical protein